MRRAALVALCVAALLPLTVTAADAGTASAEPAPRCTVGVAADTATAVAAAVAGLVAVVAGVDASAGLCATAPVVLPRCSVLLAALLVPAPGIEETPCLPSPLLPTPVLNQ